MSVLFLCINTLIANEYRCVVDAQDWLYGDGEHESAARYASEAAKLQKVLDHVQSAAR